MMNKYIVQKLNVLRGTENQSCYISSAIPKARFSIGVNAPAVDALLQSPSDSFPELSSRSEYLENQAFDQS